MLPGFGPGFFRSLPSRLVFTGVAVAPPAPDCCGLLLLGSVDSFQVWSQTYFFLFVFSLNKTIMDVPGKQINDHSLGRRILITFVPYGLLPALLTISGLEGLSELK